MNATVKLKLKPLMVPNFAIIDMSPPPNTANTGNTTGIPLSQLDEEALEELAYGFLTDFYKKAGKSCPFYRPTRDVRQS